MRVSFEIFNKLLEANRKATNEWRRGLFYYEGETKFFLYIKTPDFWEVESVIEKESLPQVGVATETSNVVDDFRAGYLYDAIVIERPLSVEEDTAVEKVMLESEE